MKFKTGFVFFCIFVVLFATSASAAEGRTIQYRTIGNVCCFCLNDLEKVSDISVETAYGAYMDKGDDEMKAALMQYYAADIAVLQSQASPFVVVSDEDWFFDDVMYGFFSGLMTGTSTTSFSPNTPATRAMILTMLHRMEGSPDIPSDIDVPSFDDASDAWYFDALRWAVYEGLVSGYGDGRFGPNDSITREQLAVLLFRYAQSKGLTAVTPKEHLLGFCDREMISTYAISAMNWAVGQNLISGDTGGRLNPCGDATRAQVAAVLHRFYEIILK
jgi:hypothetical protein